MTIKRHTSVNQTQIARIRAIWDAMFDEVLNSGVHGCAKMELTIADGTIQKISRTVEKIEKVR
jgi:hypothetical protein